MGTAEHNKEPDSPTNTGITAPTNPDYKRNFGLAAGRWHKRALAGGDGGRRRAAPAFTREGLCPDSKQNPSLTVDMLPIAGGVTGDQRCLTPALANAASVGSLTGALPSASSIASSVSAESSMPDAEALA